MEIGHTQAYRLYENSVSKSTIKYMVTMRLSVFMCDNFKFPSKKRTSK
jgi:hypothetical protein